VESTTGLLSGVELADNESERRSGVAVWVASLPLLAKLAIGRVLILASPNVATVLVDRMVVMEDDDRDGRATASV
jgi:hypothetical protein